MDFDALGNFIISTGLSLWNFMLSNILTASILLVLIIFPKLFKLFRHFVTGR